MMQYFYNNPFQSLAWPWPIVLLALMIWSLTWKGIALWTSARKGDRTWFVALLLINLLGILEILYIYIFSKRGGEKPLQDSIEKGQS